MNIWPPCSDSALCPLLFTPSLSRCPQWWNSLFDLSTLPLVGLSTTQFKTQPVWLWQNLGERCISSLCCSICRIALISPKGAVQLLVKTSGHIFNWLVQRETASFVTCCWLVFGEATVVFPRLSHLIFCFSLSFGYRSQFSLCFFFMYSCYVMNVLLSSPLLSSPLLSSPLLSSPLSVILFLCDLLIRAPSFLSLPLPLFLLAASAVLGPLSHSSFNFSTLSLSLPSPCLTHTLSSCSPLSLSLSLLSLCSRLSLLRYFFLSIPPLF